jgi:hypothetical protein
MQHSGTILLVALGLLAWVYIGREAVRFNDLLTETIAHTVVSR